MHYFDGVWVLFGGDDERLVSYQVDAGKFVAIYYCPDGRGKSAYSVFLSDRALL